MAGPDTCISTPEPEQPKSCCSCMRLMHLVTSSNPWRITGSDRTDAWRGHVAWFFCQLVTHSWNSTMCPQHFVTTGNVTVLLHTIHWNDCCMLLTTAEFGSVGIFCGVWCAHAKIALAPPRADRAEILVCLAE